MCQPASAVSHTRRNPRFPTEFAQAGLRCWLALASICRRLLGLALMRLLAKFVAVAPGGAVSYPVVDIVHLKLQQVVGYADAINALKLMRFLVIYRR